jgi:hypothetical protein
MVLAMRDAPAHRKAKWPLYVGLFVWAGMAATIALAVIESWWG